MKGKFVTSNIIMLFVVSIISVIGIVFFSKIGYSVYTYIPLDDPEKGLGILSTVVFITLVLERALEMLMNLWREPGKVNGKLRKEAFEEKIAILEKIVSDLEKEIELSTNDKLKKEKEKQIEEKQSIIAVTQEKLDLVLADLDDYKVTTKQYAHVTSFIIGIFISLAGFGILNHFFVYEELQNVVDQNKEKVALVELSANEFYTIDSLAKTIEKPDTLQYVNTKGEKIALANPFYGYSEKIIGLDSLFSESTLTQDYINQNSNILQQKLFMILNLLITALLISGGTDGMHKLANVYTSFLDGMKIQNEKKD